MTVTLEESYQRCRRLNYRHGTTYYWAAQVLPRSKRNHVHALYAMCRYADDIVDDVETPVAEKAKALADFGERLRCELATGQSEHPVLKAVVHTLTTFQIPPSCADRFLASMTMDLTTTTYQSFADLLVYMDGSAAVIGEMMLPILEPLSPEAFAPARDLGIAFQLTNFLRDIDEDLDRGRVYLPQEDVEHFGAQRALDQRQVTAEFIEFMRFEVSRTQEIYRSADLGLAMLPRTSARSIGAARVLYGGILGRIEAAGYDVFRARVRVPTWKKLATAARFAVRVR